MTPFHLSDDHDTASPRGGRSAQRIRRTARSAARLLALLVAVAAAPPARAQLRVITTIEGLASLAREVGGKRVEVESLSRGVQDPHFVDPNPTLVVKLRRADLLVDVGLDLEIGRLPPLVNQARTAELNPHFLTDPRRAGNVAAPMAAKLAELDPAGAATYRANLAAFQKRLAEAEARWTRVLAPLKGRKLVTRHRTLTYFLDWSGLVLAGVLEPKPGVPPPPSHLAEQIGRASC